MASRGYSRSQNNYNRRPEIKTVTEISPQELVSRLVPINMNNSYMKRCIEVKRDLRQKRREIFAKYNPLYYENGNRKYTSYEIDKLAKGEPILPLANPIEISVKLEEYIDKSKKPKTEKLLENTKDEEDLNFEDEDKNDADKEKNSESDDLSESEEEMDSAEEFAEEESSEDDDD